MTIGFRAASAATVALVCGLGLATAGCGKYSYGTLKAIKAFKDGNLAYGQKDWRKAAADYERVVQNEDAFARYPQLATAYFFLGNSYDQLYKPAKQGDPTNDAYIQKAIADYRKAADTITDKNWKKSALEYLAAAYGPDKLNDAAKAEAVKPNDPSVLAAKAGYYNRQGDFGKTIDALEKAATLEPNNPEGYHRVATFYWEKANKDYRLSPAQKRDYILKGLAMEDKALSLNPEYMEAMTYKNILLRMQANTEKDPKVQKDLIDKADQLRNKVIEAQKRKQTGKG